MLLFRVTTSVFANDLSGRGAQIYGGRWNPKGMAVLYTAETAAQALLEFLPHFSEICVPANLVLVTIFAPDDLQIEEVNKNSLAETWDAKPPTSVSKEIGREWLLRADTVALRVPSVMLPFGKSWNMVLNPAHNQYLLLEVMEVTPITVDPRVKNMI